MLLMVIRKMLSNKWMMLCLLLGMVLAVGMVSSIPMYTEGVLNRMLRRDLEEEQTRSGIYSGRWLVKVPIEISYSPSARPQGFQFFKYYVPLKQDLVPVDSKMKICTLTSATLRATFPPTLKYEQGKATVRMLSITDIMEKITVFNGKFPEHGVKEENGKLIVEGLMSNSLMISDDFRVGQELQIADFSNRFDNIVLRIVGVFEQTDPTEDYWYTGLSNAEVGFVLNEADFYTLFIDREEAFSLANAEWYQALDYSQVQLANLTEVVNGLNEQIRWFDMYKVGPLRVPMMNTLQSYADREAQLRTMLLVLQVPILLMLAFYIFMVAQLIVDYERNEISILKSRGAGRGNVLLLYLVENLIIGLLAMVLGPILGWFVCSVLGASNGFLEFVSRSALSIRFNANALTFSLITIGFAVTMMLIPVMLQSRKSIVEQKTSKATKGMPFWQKIFLDVILIAVSFYGLNIYQTRQATLSVTPTTDAMAVPIDPLLFMVSTLFILGVGLLFLRLFPLLVRLVFAIGKKIWSPALYASFISVGRSGGQEQFLMLFLVLTLSLGIFNANAARTINQNAEEKINYLNGADIIVDPLWRSNIVPHDEDPNTGVKTSEASVNPGDAGFGGDRISYIEPPFEPWTTLDGVEQAAKVLTNDAITVDILGRNAQQSRFMAVDPTSFSKVTYMPQGLLNPHFNVWLNQLTMDPRACLLSQNYADEMGVSLGDTIQISWAEQNKVDLIVYGFVNYWPTHNPYMTGKGQNCMVVANLSYIQAKMAVEPYEIWIKREDNTTSQTVYDAIKESKLPIQRITDSTQQLIRVKNEPMLQGANGAMTMGFIVTMLVSAVGFIIYWILSIKARVLQFGILRAMGLTFGKLIGMLLSEQLLISGTALLMGILTGGVAAKLFVPMLGMVYSAQSQVPPFRVIADQSDYVKIYIIVGFILVVGLVVLARLIAKIKITQALKLGED